MSKIINVIINGYTKWIKLYSKMEIKDNTKIVIEYLCDNDYFEYNDIYDDIKLLSVNYNNDVDKIRYLRKVRFNYVY